MTKLTTIEGIGPAYAEKLSKARVRSVEALLEAGTTPAGRKKLAEETGISPDLILKWVNLADMMRVPGIGEEYSELLEQAGVDTVVELARRNPGNLHAKLMEINQARNLVRRLPSLGMVTRWVEEAGKLERVISY